MGFATLPPFLVEQEIANGQLVSVANDWSMDGFPVQVLMPQQKAVPARIRKFIDHLQTELGPMIR